MKPKFSSLCSLIACSVALLLSASSLRAQDERGAGVRPLATGQRVALVVGNADYNGDIGRLKNPSNDAADVAAALSRLGFQLVGDKAHFNLNKRQMLELIREFGRQIQTGGAGVFYFAGHGVQVDRRNYLIPITDLLRYQEDAEFEAVDVDTILREMEYAENTVKVLILDACRNNNLPKRRRITANGLAEPALKPEGILIAFATADGQTASDNAEGRNGLFTQELLKHIETPNVSLDRVFRTIRNEVKRLSKNTQLPFLYQSLSEDVFLKTTEMAAVRPDATPSDTANNSATAPDIELTVFQATNGKWGYKNKENGSVVIAPGYDHAWEFKEGLAQIEIDGKRGFIDKAGKMVVSPKYDYSWGFYAGVAQVKLNGKYGLIDKTGNEIVPLKYEFLSPFFYNDLMRVKLNNKWGFVDRAGKEVIPTIYDVVYDFSGDLAGVQLDGKWGFINKRGKVIIPFKYERVGAFRERLAAVWLDGKGGYINKTGEVVIPIKYEGVGSFFGGLASVKLGGKYGYIDRTGKMVIPPKFDAANAFIGGRARVTLNGKKFYIDKTGGEVAPD